jgi:hypothetical protein
MTPSATPVTSWIECSTNCSRTTSSPCLDWQGRGRNPDPEDTGAWRVIYTARLADAVYVLHAFQKKTQATSKRDIELAEQRFAQLIRKRS